MLHEALLPLELVLPVLPVEHLRGDSLDGATGDTVGGHTCQTGKRVKPLLHALCGLCELRIATLTDSIRIGSRVVEGLGAAHGAERVPRLLRVELVRGQALLAHPQLELFLWHDEELALLELADGAAAIEGMISACPWRRFCAVVPAAVCLLAYHDLGHGRRPHLELHLPAVATPGMDHVLVGGSVVGGGHHDDDVLCHRHTAELIAFEGTLCFSSPQRNWFLRNSLVVVSATSFRSLSQSRTSYRGENNAMKDTRRAWILLGSAVEWEKVISVPTFPPVRTTYTKYVVGIVESRRRGLNQARILHLVMGSSSSS